MLPFLFTLLGDHKFVLQCSLPVLVNIKPDYYYYLFTPFNAHFLGGHHLYMSIFLCVCVSVHQNCFGVLFAPPPSVCLFGLPPTLFERSCLTSSPCSCIVWGGTVGQNHSAQYLNKINISKWTSLWSKY